MIPFPPRTRAGYPGGYLADYEAITELRPSQVHYHTAYHGAPLLDHAPAELALHHQATSPGPMTRLPVRAQPPVNVNPMHAIHPVRVHAYAERPSPNYISSEAVPDIHLRTVNYDRHHSHHPDDEYAYAEDTVDRQLEDVTLEEGGDPTLVFCDVTSMRGDLDSGGFLPAEDPVEVDERVDFYLQTFRVNQCMAFKQHKCNKHKPYICFDWHFRNQRRRRPILRSDKTYNYSPDVYCTEYNETTGECINGDTCPYLHRNTNDTERRYHIRYYKTQICNFETDVRTGHCTKNGAHCAYAHGVTQLRRPTFSLFTSDVPTTTRFADALCQSDFSSGLGVSSNITPSERDPVTVQGSSTIPTDDNVNTGGIMTLHVEHEALLEQQKEICREKIIPDDYRWEDANFVQIHYKNEKCTKPPRLCRQGYACPFFHNPRDRRRSPKIYSYKSTACPHVKIGMDWKDPNMCPEGDCCEYCHTRTEQQFHQDIYKSNKCNDMQQSGYCPRGNFCAFAHVENSKSGSNASLHKGPRRIASMTGADTPRKKASDADSASGSENGGTTRWGINRRMTTAAETICIPRGHTAPPLSIRNRINSDSNLLKRGGRELCILSPINGDNEVRATGEDKLTALAGSSRRDDDFNFIRAHSISVLKSGYRSAGGSIETKRAERMRGRHSENWTLSNLPSLPRRPETLGVLSPGGNVNHGSSPESHEVVTHAPRTHRGTGSIQIPPNAERQRLSGSFSSFDKAPGSISARTSIFDQPADSYDTPRSTEAADFGFSERMNSKSDLSTIGPGQQGVTSSEDDRAGGTSSSMSSTTVVATATTMTHRGSRGGQTGRTGGRVSHQTSHQTLITPNRSITDAPVNVVDSMDGGLTSHTFNSSPTAVQCSVQDTELEKIHCELKKRYASLQETHEAVMIQNRELLEQVTALGAKVTSMEINKNFLYTIGPKVDLVSMPQKQLFSLREQLKQGVNAIEEVIFSDMRLEGDSAVEKSTLNSRRSGMLDKSARSFSPSSNDSKGSLKHKLVLDCSQGDLHSSINSGDLTGGD